MSHCLCDIGGNFEAFASLWDRISLGKFVHVIFLWFFPTGSEVSNFLGYDALGDFFPS